jgi:kynurenine formamidase
VRRPRVHLIALPLKIVAADASPARVIAVERD